MRRHLILAPLALLLAACHVDGSGHYDTSTRHVGRFSGVDMKVGQAQLDLVIDDTLDRAQVIVAGDDNLLHHVRTQVDDGVLEIDADWWLSPELELVIRVRTPRLTRLEADSGSRAEVRGLDQGYFEVELDEGAEARLEGRVGRLEVDLDSGAALFAADLVADEVHVDLKGGSYADVCAVERLEGDADGGADLDYQCDPRVVRVDADGGADLHPR